MTGRSIPGLIAGVVLSAFSIFAEHRLRKAPSRVIIGGIVGLVFAVAGIAILFGIYRMFQGSFPLDSPSLEKWGVAGFSLVILVLGYMGLSLGIKKGSQFDLLKFPFFKKETEGRMCNKILDTSVIIDGRIADIADAGFLEGVIVLPQFVLRELQYVADSSDTLKRNRGRRGLDIIQRLQKRADINVHISEADFPEIRDVDMKLIELAMQLGGKIVTNDFNLNKISGIRGVEVLNINELANALKPVVLPGESMKVFILKEGKEPNQGVAYLDDGTMVVVDNARKVMGKTVHIEVTSVLQTTAGKMIFGKYSSYGYDDRSEKRQPQKNNVKE
jgi:uncharacterized protein YacL